MPRSSWFFPLRPQTPQGTRKDYYECGAFPRLLHRQHHWAILLQNRVEPNLSTGNLEYDIAHLLEVAVILLLWFLLARYNKSRDQTQGIIGLESEEEKDRQERERDETALSDMTYSEILNFQYIY